VAEFDEYDRPGGGRPADQLRRIARYQRWLIAVVLGQLVLWLAFIVLMALDPNDVGDAIAFPMVLTLILGGVGAVFVFLTAWELRGAFAALVFGLATFVPCMGLLVITLVNGYATAELKKHGLRVGLFGASAADVEDRRSLYDDEDAGW
jgi:hypothetical protein